MTELKKLKSACNNTIMINQSDKDSKLVLVNMADYKRKINDEIRKNFVPVSFPTTKETEKLKEKTREQCKILHKKEILSDACLFGTTGLRFKENLDIIRHNKTEHIECNK